MDGPDTDSVSVVSDCIKLNFVQETELVPLPSDTSPIWSYGFGFFLHLHQSKQHKPQQWLEKQNERLQMPHLKMTAELLL